MSENKKYTFTNETQRRANNNTNQQRTYQQPRKQQPVQPKMQVNQQDEKADVKKSVREEFAEKFISVLQSDKPLEWVQGWASIGMGRPYNGGSNRHYNGVNRFILGFTAFEKGWTDPRFYTFKQASDEGYSITKGE